MLGALRPPRLGGDKRRVELACDTSHDLVLGGEEIPERLIEAICPEVRAGFGVDKLALMRIRSPLLKMLPSSA
jgi:hypothetical protein